MVATEEKGMSTDSSFWDHEYLSKIALQYFKYLLTKVVDDCNPNSFATNIAKREIFHGEK